MAVLLETSKGDMVVDLHTDETPLACKNFLKLCKMKYYNNCLFHNVQHNFIAQTGDPTGTGRGGTSLYGHLYGEQARFFEDEIVGSRKHSNRGTVAMASGGENLNASQFYITLADNVDSLDGKHTIFGEVAEGLDILDAINDSYVDDEGRPYQNIRVRHTIILDDPYPDPPHLEEHIPENSPEPVFEQGDRLEDDWAPGQDARSAEEVEKDTRAHEAQNRAVVLEMIGDLPDADVKPPSDMLFVCKLNPVTTEEDLEIIFSRFGNVTSCDIIRDWKTGDSLSYGFIGFDRDGAAEEAYFKMNNVLIDDRRIKVDFSQSVYHLWKQFRRFGRKGNEEGAKEAQEHKRIERSNLERKAAHGNGRGPSHQLLFDHAHTLQHLNRNGTPEAAAHARGSHAHGERHARGSRSPARAHERDGSRHGVARHHRVHRPHDAPEEAAAVGRHPAQTARDGRREGGGGDMRPSRPEPHKSSHREHEGPSDQKATHATSPRSESPSHRKRHRHRHSSRGDDESDEGSDRSPSKRHHGHLHRQGREHHSHHHHHHRHRHHSPHRKRDRDDRPRSNEDHRKERH